MPPSNKPVWLKTITEPRKTAFYGRFYIHSKRTPYRGDWCCWPNTPERPLLAWKIARLCGLRPVARPTDNTRLGLLFSYETHVKAPSPGGLPEGVPIINGRCTDISKERVEVIHQKAFGYGMAVDPTTHAGPMVVKSDTNALHDGRVVQGPVRDPEPGSVYQIEIDNRASDIDGRAVRTPMVLDLRVTVVGEELAGAFRKYRPTRDRFLNTNDHAFFHRPGDLFSDEEQRQILAFAREIGLELGEIDVLRDNNSGRIYAIDANSTPHSPPTVLEGPLAAWPIMTSAAQAFERQYLSGTPGQATQPAAERAPINSP
ncbi:MAG: hypothetical protein ACIAS6_08055 [Phycisphaerales bacterium JB060]